MLPGSGGVAGGEMMRVAGLFPVGQTEGGCLAAIRKILEGEESLEAYLLHGELAPGQKPPDPEEVARRISMEDFGGRVRYREVAAIDTFDLSGAYSKARAVVGALAKERYDRVYVGITGGTNPLVASVFHTALSYVEGEVVPIYAQGKGQTTERVYVAPDIRLAALGEEAMRVARSGQLRVAARLAERMPEGGKWGFARACLAALAAWDDFDYEGARDTLRRQARHCGAYERDALLGPLADSVARLARVADGMVGITHNFRDEQGLGKRAAAPGWAGKVREFGGLLVADALANARRRYQEGRYTDAVLRCYRAGECAVQVRLYEMGIDPAKPEANKAAPGRIEDTGDGAKPLTFWKGLNELAERGAIRRERIEKNVQDLSQTRNKTYLEHGYVRIRREQAERCLEYAKAVVEELLGAETVAAWPDLEMRF
jgi:HEPN domain-containing protein